MKIRGLKYLNNNWYDSIMIRNLNSYETKIEVRFQDKIDLKEDKVFSDSIKLLNPKDKINEIVRYYLRNNKIYSIKDKCELNHYDGKFIVIEGTRNLYLQLKDGSLDKEVFKRNNKKVYKR